MKPSSSHPEPSEDAIQHAAYFLWLQSGRPHGRDVENWHAAKELLRHHVPVPATSSRRRRTTSDTAPAPDVRSPKAPHT